MNSDNAGARCWADNIGASNIFPHPIECQAIADGRCGLCKKHALEVLGPEQPAEVAV